MKVKLSRDGEAIEVDRIEIMIGETIYRISETPEPYKQDGNLKINKHDYEGSSSLQITPCVSNEIIIK